MKEQILKYETEKYNFRGIVGDLLTDDLELIHKRYATIPNVIEGVGKDSDTYQHTRFYNKMRSGWVELESSYEMFIRHEIFPLIGGDKLVYQKFPTFRIHFPDNKVVSEWHCDGQDGYNHPKGEINIWLPLTVAFNTNTIWTESEPGLKDFHPIDIDYGQYLMFNGNECVHGNKINTTTLCRVSFDFRVIPFKDYDENYSSGSATTGSKFVIGEYFNLMSNK